MGEGDAAGGADEEGGERGAAAEAAERETVGEAFASDEQHERPH